MKSFLPSWAQHLGYGITVSFETRKLSGGATYRTVRITVAAINSLLEDTVVPTVIHIGVVSVPSIITV